MSLTLKKPASFQDKVKKKATAESIMKKVNRKRHPVSSITELAREYGVPISGSYWSSGTSVPHWFKTHVKRMVGEGGYNQIRDAKQVRGWEYNKIQSNR